MVVFVVDVVEGKDLPTEIGEPEFEVDYGATGGLMMRMTKPLFGARKDVVTESIFCVLKGILGMLAHGVYGTVLIKKKDIVSTTAREMPLSHDSNTRRLGMFMVFVVIWMGTSIRYSV